MLIWSGGFWGETTVFGVRWRDCMLIMQDDVSCDTVILLHSRLGYHDNYISNVPTLLCRCRGNSGIHVCRVCISICHNLEGGDLLDCGVVPLWPLYSETACHWFIAMAICNHDNKGEGRVKTRRWGISSLSNILVQWEDTNSFKLPKGCSEIVAP